MRAATSEIAAARADEGLPGRGYRWVPPGQIFCGPATSH